MIYIGKVKPSILNEPVNQPIIEYFKNYQPLEIQVPDDKDKQSELKTTVLNGFISGDMKALIRNNNNLVSRDCLTIEKGYTALEVMQERLEKNPKLFIKIVRSGN